MDDNQKEKKRLRAMIIVMAVVVIPGLVRALSSSAFESVRSVDMAVLFASGMAAGVLLVSVRDYIQVKDEQ